MSTLGIGINVWNGQKYIKRVILSLLSQSYQDYKIIILDNNSNDNTVKIIKKIISRNKNKIILIKDIKNRTIFEAQKHLLNNFLFKFKYSMIANDDDFYNTKYISTLLPKIINERVSMVYSFKKYIDDKNKFYYMSNYPCYSLNDSKFFNTLKFIIFRNHMQISFGIFTTKSYIELMKHSQVYDSSGTNSDNISMIYFLLNHKVDHTKKFLFYYSKKDRSKISQERKLFIYSRAISMIKIFKYEYIYFLKAKKLIFQSIHQNLIQKLLLVFFLIIIFFQKTFSYNFKFLYKLINAKIYK